MASVWIYNIYAKVWLYIRCHLKGKGNLSWSEETPQKKFIPNFCYIHHNFQMSESSSTIPTHTIKVPTAETIDREKPQIEIQSITMKISSPQEVMVMDNNISYGSLPKPPVCNANQYGNCIKPVDEDYRPCTVYNRCKRDNHWSESTSEF